MIKILELPKCALMCHNVPLGTQANIGFVFMTQKPFRKHIRFHPEEPSHAKVLKWMRAQQRGSDNENLIHLMILGLKVENGEISRNTSSPTQSATTNINLLPEIRKIVNAAITSALRDADIQISQDDQEKLADEETQAFLIDMADNF